MSFFKDIVKSAAGSLVGGAFSLLGGSKDRKASSNQLNIQLGEAAKDRELQKEFAQKGLQWKVDDARAAGLHPLFALGGQTASYSPTAFIPGQSPRGSSLRDVGQAAQQAIDRYMARPNALERQQQRYRDRLQDRMLEAQVKTAEAEALTASKVALGMQPGYQGAGSSAITLGGQAIGTGSVTGSSPIPGQSLRLPQVTPQDWDYLEKRAKDPESMPADIPRKQITVGPARTHIHEGGTKTDLYLRGDEVAQVEEVLKVPWGWLKEKYPDSARVIVNAWKYGPPGAVQWALEKVLRGIDPEGIRGSNKPRHPNAKKPSVRRPAWSRGSAR